MLTGRRWQVVLAIAKSISGRTRWRFAGHDWWSLLLLRRLLWLTRHRRCMGHWRKSRLNIRLCSCHHWRWCAHSICWRKLIVVSWTRKVLLLLLHWTRSAGHWRWQRLLIVIEHRLLLCLWRKLWCHRHWRLGRARKVHVAHLLTQLKWQKGKIQSTLQR